MEIGVVIRTDSWSPLQQFLQHAHQVQQLMVFPGLLELMNAHNLHLTEDKMNSNSASIYDAIDINTLI